MSRLAYYLRILLLIGFILGHSGIPVFEFPKQSAGRFPCEGHGCGCTSADRCWHHCCCMSLTDRLAWAHQNGVEPPLDRVAVAEPADHCAHDAHDEASCCDNHRSDTENSKALATRSRVRWTLGISAMKCRGMNLHWTAGLNLTGPLDESASINLVPVQTDTIAIVNDSLITLSHSPPLSFG